MDAAVERTGMYSQGELPRKRGSSRGASRNVPFLTFCPGVQRVQKTYVGQLLYSLVAYCMNSKGPCISALSSLYVLREAADGRILKQIRNLYLAGKAGINLFVNSHQHQGIGPQFKQVLV